MGFISRVGVGFSLSKEQLLLYAASAPFLRSENVREQFFQSLFIIRTNTTKVPEKARWLNDRQKHIATARITIDRGDGEYTKVSVSQSMKFLLDWKLAVYCMQYYVCASSVYSLAYFTPVILKDGLGFNQALSLILTSPPYIFTILMTIGLSRFSDKVRLRWPFMVGQSITAIVGLLIILYVKAPGGRLFGIFLAVFGTQANVPATLAYGQNQTVRQEKRGIVSAAMITIGAAGGVTGSTIFRAQDAPLYLPGMWTTIAMQVAYSIGTYAMSMYLKRKNKQVDEGKVTALEGVEGFRYAP